MMSLFVGHMSQKKRMNNNGFTKCTISLKYIIKGILGKEEIIVVEGK